MRPFSEEMLTLFRDMVLPRYHDVSAVLSIDAMHGLADAVAAVGEEWHLLPLVPIWLGITRIWSDV